MSIGRTLRGRLVLAMMAVFVLALACSAWLDQASGPVARALDREPYQDGLVLALFSLPALALIWLISSWGLRPLLRASEEARRAGPQNPGARLSRTGMPAEIAPLVDAVNGALDRMAAAFAAERRFTENAAHELRTPLAVLGLRLQRARDAGPGSAPDWPAIEHDLAQMNRLVDQMLDLARKEHGGRVTADRAEVNLSRVAREAAASVLPLVEARGRMLSVDLPDMLRVRGAADDLRDAVRNLLENAILHGKGCIRMVGEQGDDRAMLTISDEGAGLDDAMFERFHKSGTSAGSGLGLAIVREVARSHGGEAIIIPGQGSQVSVRLPLLV